jgi:hypothetical protein
MSEDIILDKKITDGPDDLGGMFAHIFGLVPWKVTIFVFIAFIVLNTSTFVDHILGSWPGAVEGRYPTEKGLVIQGSLLALGVVIISICVGGDLL